MPRNKIIPYNPKLKMLSRELRKNATYTERKLWEEIRHKQFGFQFHRQVPIDNYIVDFYCHELRLAIEVDGCSHDFEEAFKADHNRQSRLESLGVKVIRFDDREIVHDMNNVIRTIEITIEIINRSL